MTRIPVSYNGRFLASRHPTGTHRSALMFLRALAEHSDTLDISLHAPRPEHAFSDLRVLNARYREVRVSGAAGWHLWEQAIWPKVACGIAINPINTGPFLPGMARQVVFAHDLNILKFPGNYSWKFRYWYEFASCRAIRRALHVVCFTEYVKRDIVTFLGIPPSRISVLPQGPGLPLKEIEKPRVRRGRYFLCVGGMQPHKNLKGSLEAWRLSGLGARGYVLKIVGKPQANYAPLGIGAELLGQRGVEFTGYIDDPKLMELYRDCAGFIYPSFEEGFGLPVVEAFYLGAPVITSNRSCLPEIAGDAALLIDPGQPSDIAQAMERLASDEGEASRLVAAGGKRAELYSWDNAGRLLAALLKRLYCENGLIC